MTDRLKHIVTLEKRDLRRRAGPARLADLVLLHRLRRRAGAGRARDVDRADPADLVHVPAGLSLQVAAADLNHVLVAVYIGICVYSFIYFLFRVRTHRHLRAWATFTRQDFIVGLLVFLLVMELSRLAHPALFWVNVVLVLYTLWGYPEPDRLLLASRHDLLPRRHLEHGGVLDRHLRHLRPAGTDLDRRLPAAGGGRQRLRRTERHDPGDAPDRRPLSAS